MNTSPNIQYQSNEYDIFNEFKDRFSREKNILLFNIPEIISNHEDPEVPLKLVLISLLNIKITRSNRLGKFQSKNRPILLELDSPSNVLEMLKSKHKLRSIELWRFNISFNIRR